MALLTNGSHMPAKEPKYSKQILKLSRLDLKLIEIISGHNNLNTFSTKIKPLENTQCRFCTSAPETTIHLTNHRMQTILH